MDADALRKLATMTIDAATHAGADWADVRIGDRRVYRGNIFLRVGFGVRVRVGNAEAFVGGGDPTPERLVAAARAAVSTARGFARSPAWSADASLALAPTPRVAGEWRAPIEIDPFSVPIDEHRYVEKSLSGRFDVRLSQVGFTGGRKSFEWYGETRAFASSEGSLVIQFLGGVYANGHTTAGGSWWRLQRDENIELSIPDYESCTGGFEIVVRPNRFDRLETLVRELAQYAKLRSGLLDVGRYNVVLDGSAHASLLNSTVVPALSLRRVLGHDVDIDGTSPLSPAEDVLGQPLFAPSMMLNVDADVPHLGAAAWDDEGVARRAVPLITHGRIVSYLSSRATLPAIAALATQRGLSTQLPGIANTPDVTHSPTEIPASVSMPPASAMASNAGTLAGLAKQLGTGLLARGGWVIVNTQGVGGYIAPHMMFEVRGGELVRRVFGARLLFSTKKLFPTLTAVGDASTVDNSTQGMPVAFPSMMVSSVVTAPAALYRNLDVVDTRVQIS